MAGAFGGRSTSSGFSPTTTLGNSRGCSSVGQSRGLIIPRSWVRSPPAPPDEPNKLVGNPTKYGSPDDLSGEFSEPRVETGKVCFQDRLGGLVEPGRGFPVPHAKGFGTSQFLTRIWAFCLRPGECHGTGGNWIVFEMRAEVLKQFIFMSLARQGLIRIPSYSSLCRLAD